MAHKRMEMILVLAAMAMLWIGATAQSSSCTNVLISMSPCLNYITGNSSTPSSSCCSQLATVVQSQPQCLCQVLNGGSSSLGININQTQALALPSACNVQTAPISRCNAAAPAGFPAESPESQTVPSDGGSKNVPSTNGTSDGSSIKVSIPVFVFALIAASYASSFSTF